MADKRFTGKSRISVLVLTVVLLDLIVVVGGAFNWNGIYLRSKSRGEVDSDEAVERTHHNEQRLTKWPEGHRRSFESGRGQGPGGHHFRKHRKESEWESLLLKPLNKKYPKLRQLYKRALGGSTSSSERPPIRSQVSIPKFELPQYQHFCDEDVPIGTSLLQVRVISDEGEAIHYALSDSVNFTIDDEGVIRSNARLDADYNGALYTFNVTATVDGSDLSGLTSVRIYTTNKNDEPPIFSQDIYPSRVDETAKPGRVVITVVATDKDGDTVKYGLSPGNAVPPDMFVLDANTGVIRLGHNLKFDLDSYELNVTATDDGSCCVGGADTIHTSTTLVVVTIIDVNDHKPVFKNCESYRPTVKENSPPGTPVTTVKAEDEDRGANGQVTYQVLQLSEQLFRIDENTGAVTTAKIFDREGADGKSVSITVSAQDKGTPPLEGVCSFKVLIGDVNDNRPMFDRKAYNEKLKQQTMAPSDIFRLSATDDDADNNSVIVYSLQADPEALEYFEVNPDSGWVMLKKTLGSKSFAFKAVATDKGDPPLTSSVDVTIEVFEANVNPPSFHDTPYIIEIPENTKADFPIKSISASSGVKDNSRVTFKLVDGNTAQTNKDRTFYLQPRGNFEADIYVQKPLDYESIKEYNITVRVENPNTQGNETTIFIKLKDVNDEMPQFEANERLSVLEAEPAGAKVGQLHAFDKDSTPPFNTVTFELVGPDNVNELFKIDPNTGELTTMQTFDRETNQTFQIRVKITDGAESARPSAKPGEHNSYFNDFLVHIDDKNDNVPEFVKLVYQAEVNENEDIGHVIITVQATDKDQSSKLRYEITEGNVGSAFSIKADTGSIVVAGNIDYETLEKYTLVVTVSDGLNEATARVEITVADLNDNPPKFDKSVYEVTIWERAATNFTGLPEIIVTVSVTDADKSREQNFFFFLTGQANELGSNGKPIFQIEPKSGVISVNSPLDRDPPNGRPTWRFNVFAQDEGGQAGALDGYAEVVVKLRDINDNDPEFPEPSYVGYVPENANLGREIMTMTAVDNDDPNEGRNAVLSYSILQNAADDDGKTLFAIDVSSAMIKTSTANLDREKIDAYTIVVEAKDGGGRTGTGTVTIMVTDVNDNPPRFEKSEYNITIPESVRGSTVLILNVLDDDLPDTNNNFFSIVKDSGFGWEFFKVVTKNKTAAELQVYVALDYENPEHRKGFTFRVRVNDMGPSSNDSGHTAFCQVTITITDVNDNAPVFDSVTQNVSIKEDAPLGTSIARFHATDADNDGNSKVSYSIEHSTNRHRQFVIDADGMVTIQRPLDRETVERHVLHILAKDDGAPQQTSTATLTVNVLDVNDNAPVFKEDYRPVVPEGVPPRIFVVELEAYDPDDYAAGNGPPFIFALANTSSTVIKESFDFQFTKGGGAKGEGSMKIYTKVEFDREEQKEYFVPIVIQDSGTPTMSATLTLTIIIGDKNDNPMGDGSTEIFVYNYKGEAPESVIGRVYVDDKDDWDLPDKTFSWRDADGHPNFKLEQDNGNIVMLPRTLGGVYVLYFTVDDNVRHEHANANATVTVKEISETAVYSSGSVRMADITEEEFISVWDAKANAPKKSKYAIMKEKIASLIGAKLENVDLFTVKKKFGPVPLLDARFSAHGSPFYKPEQINGILSGSRIEIEVAVGVNIVMISIDECLYENINCESSCTNVLETNVRPYVVNANRSSLAGVDSEVVAHCTCRARNFSNLENCGTIKCFNGGTCVTFPNGKARCFCPRGFDGPRCQRTTIGFRNVGYAWFPAFEQCEESHFSLEFLTEKGDGLLFYNGPVADPDPHETVVRDFISLELQAGLPRLLIDFGSGTLELIVKGKTLNDKEWHTIDVFWQPEMVRLVVDFCQSGVIDDKTDTSSSPVFDRLPCEAKGTTPLYNEYLNVNSPLQIGGVSHKEKLAYGWEHEHSRTGFIGCIKNVRLNSEFYDLAASGNSFNSESGCPLTEDQCHENDIEPFCVHGACVGSKSSVACACHPGFTGDRCDLYAPNATLLSESFIKYSLKNQPHEFASDVMLKFRTSETSGELFRAVGQDPREYLTLELSGGHLVYHFNMGSLSRGNLLLANASVNDGQWHDVFLSRRGSVASIELDGGEGRRYNETLAFHGLRQLMSVNKDGIFVGGGYRDESGKLQNDFKNSCISDIRFDTRFEMLPLPPSSSENKYATVADYSNVEMQCPTADSCAGIFCPLGMSCDMFLELPICICSVVGYVVGRNGVCVDYNECDEFPCKNGGTCENLDPSYRCHCISPYTSPNCTMILEGEPLVVLGSGALAAILICALIILILVLVLVVYVRSKRTSYGPVYPDDDIRQNIINYNDEGGGEEDMNKFDINTLRIPVDGTGPIPVGAKPGPERRPKDMLPVGRSYSPGSEPPDVGDFINNNLGKANEDPDAVPSDDLRVYAFEGSGSTAGSLSSLASGTDDNEQDFDYLNNWGPRFQKLADMYGHGESEEE